MASPIQKMVVLDDAMAEILRRKTPAERFAIANGMWCFARDLLRANIAREYPELMETEIQREVATRIADPAFEEWAYKNIPLFL